MKWKQKQKERISETTNKQSIRTYTEKRLISTFKNYSFSFVEIFTWLTIFYSLLFQRFFPLHTCIGSMIWFWQVTVFMCIQKFLLFQWRFYSSVLHSLEHVLIHITIAIAYMHNNIRCAERCLTVKTWYGIYV